VKVKARLRRLLRPPKPPRSWRPEWLPRRIDLVSEAEAHPHVREERGDLFLAVDTGTTEIEVLNWLHATICMLKPSSVLETGAHLGMGTLALAAACRANGFGKVHSVELDPKSCQAVRDLLRREDLVDFAVVHCADSRTFLQETRLSFQFGFFDSLPELRAEEFAICHQRGILRGLAAFHDTSVLRTRTMDWCPPKEDHLAFRQRLKDLAAAPGCSGYFESPLSRGLFVIACPGPPREPTE
jgi:predicted O-methyltransferase YrrM